MVTRQPEQKQRACTRAFTLIELLVVIAIIAILAALLFPVFAVVREQARQSNTMSSLHAAYVGVKLFDDDEGHFPNVLYPYAETTISPVPAAPPYNRPMISTSDLPVIPMQSDDGYFTTTIANTPERGFVFPEQMKDSVTFTNEDNVGQKPTGVTTVYWPLNSPISIALGGTAADPIPVTWQAPSFTGACPPSGDSDVPQPLNSTLNYAGQPKVYYLMDSLDIGPMLNTNGTIIYFPGTTNPRYELHYSPDWTHLYGVGCDAPNGGAGNPYVTQLKYANPPSDRTIITYVTQHVLTAESSKVLTLTLNGNVRKVDVKIAGAQFPLGYTP